MKTLMNKQSESKNHISTLIQSEFKGIGIKVTNIKNHVSYDTEESCNKQHGGNWAVRLG